MSYNPREVLDSHMNGMCAKGRRPGDKYVLTHTPMGEVVTINGYPLDQCSEYVNHSALGFSWGYGGSGPAQLALALIVDAVGRPDVARRFYQDFKWAFISRLDSESNHEFTVGDVILWLGLVGFRVAVATFIDSNPDPRS
jgi:hypothetical protein